MTKKLLISNYKGGVGKTTSSVLISYLLREKGNKVLFIDLDSQMNGTEIMTKGFTESKLSLLSKQNIFTAIKDDFIIPNIIATPERNIDIVAGHPSVNLFERLMVEKGVKENQFLYFHYLMEQIEKNCNYDYIVFDMSPSKSVLNTAVMATADYHIVLTQSEILSIDMIETYLQDIRYLQKSSPYSSEILGIAVSMKDRYKHSKILLRELQSKYGTLLFDSVIKRKSLINQYTLNGYPSRKIDGGLYARDLNCLAEYIALCDEIVDRINRIKKGDF